MMEEEGRRLWCCRFFVMVVGDVFDFLCNCNGREMILNLKGMLSDNFSELP
jgi:hypothetical protein